LVEDSINAPAFHLMAQHKSNCRNQITPIDRSPLPARTLLVNVLPPLARPPLDPDFDPIRQDPQYAELVSRIGLPAE